MTVCMHYSTYIKMICLSHKTTSIFRNVHINTIVSAVDEPFLSPEMRSIQG